MSTDSWSDHTNRHIQAPWERDLVLCGETHEDSPFISGSTHECGFPIVWRSSQGAMQSMDFDHCHKSVSYTSNSGAVLNGPMQHLSLSGPLTSTGEEVFTPARRGSISRSIPSTNPYFSDPDLNYSNYGSTLQLSDPIPPLKTQPPWVQTDTIRGYVTNPYFLDPHSCNNGILNAYIARHSSMNEGKAKTTVLSAVKNEFKKSSSGVIGTRISRSVSVKNMSQTEALKTYSRSMSIDSIINVQSPIRQYTKARSLAEEVIENLVRQMVGAQNRPNMVSDMIFNPSKLCIPSGRIHDGDISRMLVQRILLLQLRELGPKLMGMAANEGEFEKQKWAFRDLKNGQIRQDYPSQGLRFLCLQQRFMEVGMETFDVLSKLRTQLPHIASEDGSQGTGILPIAVMAGNPGSTALGLHLFFLQFCPSLQIQTDLVADHVYWKETVEAICVKGLGMVCLSPMEFIKHPSCLRSYRLVFFMNVLGENFQHGEQQSGVGWWDLFWNNLYQNTSAMVLVVIHETCLVWDEIKPRKGLWWFTSVQGEESVHIVRKV
eukprot:Gb_34574 [translate_table: standard]